MFQDDSRILLQPERNGTMSLSAALLAAERTGELSADGWVAVRDLLLLSSDPFVVAAVEPLRQLLDARRTLAGARRSLEQGYATLATSGDLAQLADAAETLALLADDVAARARHCFELTQP